MATVSQRQQAVELPNSRRPGYSGIYRNVNSKDKLSVSVGEERTVYEIFEKSLKDYANRPCLGRREWQSSSQDWSPYIWETYADVGLARSLLGAGLLQLQERYSPASLKTNVNCLGIYANNRPEWVIADLAAHAYGMVTVALYDTLGAESVEYIINHTEMSLVVCSVDHIPVLIQMAAKTPSLKVIVSMDELEGPGEGVASQTKLALLNAWAGETGIRILSMSQVIKMGSESPRSARPPKPDSLITINYTSGTTGMPKGALLTHGNITAAVTTLFSVAVQTEGDIYISYLPLAHIFDRIGIATALCAGTGIGFFHGDFTKLLEDIQALKPTVMCAVPRVISRISATIQSATINAPGVRGAISRRAFAAKIAKMKAGGDSRHMFWDAVWSRKIRAALGGRLRLLVTGSALASPDTMSFLRAALGIDICDGYGLTESSACATLCLPGDCVPGHVGPPVPCNEIRLKDVPDMGYRSSDKPNPRGEIQLRGPAMFSGYFKEKAKTGASHHEQTLEPQSVSHHPQPFSLSLCNSPQVTKCQKEMEQMHGTYLFIYTLLDLRHFFIK